MATRLIKDANQKEFSVDAARIFDINGDIGEGENRHISDSVQNRVHVTNDVKYVNQKGEAIDTTQLLKDAASGKVNVIALDVHTEATHSGKNHNYCVYYEDSMEKDAETFLNPFSKPMLKNHDSYSEPIGRTRQAWHGPSQLTDERSAIHLVTRVTDTDAIQKFLDGRYATVSIGGSMGTVTCNICGKTILKDGKFNFCGHWKGETYKDQVCYWGAKDISYNEVSTVNNPADDFAQVVKVTVITDEDKENNNNGKKEGVGDMANPNATTRDSLISIIDSLLETKTGEANVADSQVANSQVEGAEPVVTTDGTDKDIIKQLEDAKQENETLKTQLADAEKAKEEAETKLKDAEKAKEEAINDTIAMKDQCIELALANKKIIADQIIELEISKKKLEDSKKDERHKELIGKSMKNLNVTLDELKKNETSTVDSQRQPAHVKNPTVPNVGEPNSVVVDASGNPIVTEDSTNQTVSVEDSNKKRSIDDYTNEIINRISKR